MTNTLQTNSFVGGMNMDIDIHAIPENQYRYAENIRIITDTEGTSGVLQNIQNIHTVDGGDFIAEDEIVLYGVTVDKYAVILTVDSKNINRVYRVSDYNNLPLKHTVVIKGKLQYSKTNRVKIVANYEAENNIKIYITDGNTPIRVLNIMDNKYVYAADGAERPIRHIKRKNRKHLQPILKVSFSGTPEDAELREIIKRYEAACSSDSRS